MSDISVDVGLLNSFVIADCVLFLVFVHSLNCHIGRDAGPPVRQNVSHSWKFGQGYQCIPRLIQYGPQQHLSHEVLFLESN